MVGAERALPKRLEGKLVRGDLYFHISALPTMPPEVQASVREAQATAGVASADNLNVVKLSRSRQQVSLLSYPGFFGEPFPQLKTAWTIWLATGECRKREYPPDGNPPILHRKELLLPPDHPDVDRFARLTVALENRGLLPSGAGLGFRRQWEQHLHLAGVRLDGHTLVEIVS